MAETTVATLNANVVLKTAEAKKNAKDLGVNMQVLNRTVRTVTSTQEKYERELENLHKAQRAGVISTKDMLTIQKRLEDQLEKTNKDIVFQAEAVKRRNLGFRAAGRDIGMGVAGRFGLAGGLAATGPVGAAVAGVGIGAAGAGRLAMGGVRATAASAERITALADVADKLGDTVGGLLAIQNAAELTGVSGDQAAMGIQRMTRRIAEAAQGTGEAVKALDELGLNARELNRLRPSDQFLRIAEAIQTVEGSGNQLRLAFKLFDSEGAALVNTLRDGTGDVISLREQLDQVYSAETINNARGATAAMTEFNMQWSVFSDTMTKQFIPGLTGALQLVNQFTGGKQAGPEGQAFGRGLLTGGLANFLVPGSGTTVSRAFQPRPGGGGGGISRPLEPAVKNLDRTMQDLTREVKKQPLYGGQITRIERL